MWQKGVENQLTATYLLQTLGGPPEIVERIFQNGAGILRLHTPRTNVKLSHRGTTYVLATFIGLLGKSRLTNPKVSTTGRWWSQIFWRRIKSTKTCGDILQHVWKGGAKWSFHKIQNDFHANWSKSQRGTEKDGQRQPYGVRTERYKSCL